MMLLITIRQEGGWRALATKSLSGIFVPHIGEKAVDCCTGIVKDVRYDYDDGVVHIEAERD